ncbi:hypothetical protein [Thalassospira xiamenensis]|uniref:Uncharacterized protein n=1 Tax=Thalassospira xiamenensis TaxID=220697 RepID=A0A285TTY8_9PROT|nr:hypothetical protein [Thalassospira xiamenensis]SOC27453.1 hypothetical protein SAMN05428964_105426 [Thalassospira xiamenensis]
MLTLPNKEAFKRLAEHFCKSPETAHLVERSITKFRLRAASMFAEAPAPGIKSMARIYRSAVFQFDDGRVGSTDLFVLADPRAFFTQDMGKASCQYSLNNGAQVFIEKQPPVMTRSVPTILDFTGGRVINTLDDQIRMLEYYLNKDLAGHPDIGDILQPVRPVIQGKSEENYGADISPHRKMRAEVSDGVKTVLRRFIESEAREALEQFRASLNQNILEAMNGAAANGIKNYNWAVGVLPDGSLDAELGRRRQQAAKAFPILYSAVGATYGPVCDAIENAEPLNPVLQNMFNIEASTLRKLNGLTVANAGMETPPNHMAIVGFTKDIEMMPDGPAPQTREGWRSYLTSVSLAKKLGRMLVGTEGATAQDVVEKFLQSGRGRWEDMSPDALEVANEGFRDMFLDLYENLLKPAAEFYRSKHNGSAYAPNYTLSEALQCLLEGWNIEQVAEACTYWDAKQAEMQHALSLAYPGSDASRERKARDSWPPLHQSEWRSKTGLLVVHLTNQDMLDDERKQLKHCINQYAKKALYEGSHLVSIRTPAGTSLGTAEIIQERLIPLVKSQDDETNNELFSLPPSVHQFRGVKNAKPPSEAWAALWEYMTAIYTGSLKIETDYLESALNDRRIGVASEHHAGACYDSQNPKAVDFAFEQFAPLLPKRVRKKGFKALFGDRFENEVYAALHEPQEPLRAPEMGA